MRKLLGRFGMIAKPFLRAVILLPLFIPAISHAQSGWWNCPNPPTISSVTPSPWVAGQTYNLVITGTGLLTPTQPCNEIPFYVTLSNGEDAALFNVSTLSATEVTATVTVPAGDSAQTACVTVEYFSADVVRKTASPNRGTCPTVTTDFGTFVPFAVPVCPGPTITSVTPSTWFAGKSYDNVKVIGTGFTTTADSNRTGCPVTLITITAADGSPVPISSVTVDSKTKITLSGVAPPTADPTETATITASTALSTGTPATLTTQPQILGNQIIFQNNPVNDPKSPPPVVVGQQIALTTPALPSGITATRTTWTVDGTRIADYAPTTDGASVTELKDEDLKKSDITFYWVYPEPSATVTYEYCVDIPEAGNQCSTANATFEVDGYDSPSINVVDNRSPSVDHLDACNGVPGGPYLDFGVLHGPHTPCTAVGQPGIQFFPEGTPPGDGDTFFVQIVNSDIEHETGRGTPYGCRARPGIDGDYPYQGDFQPSSAVDAPEDALPNDQNRATRNFNATMYLFWKSDTDDSIPVPLAYVPWKFEAGAHRILGIWSPSGGGTDQGSQLADPSQTNPRSPTEPQKTLGIPIWNGLATPTCGPQPNSAEDSATVEEL
jgi:hypothetical protein